MRKIIDVGVVSVSAHLKNYHYVDEMKCVIKSTKMFIIDLLIHWFIHWFIHAVI